MTYQDAVWATSLLLHELTVLYCKQCYRMTTMWDDMPEIYKIIAGVYAGDKLR